MQFRIAAGQEHGIGLHIRRLVGQGGERHHLGTRRTPILEHMPVGEPEGPVLRDGDPLTERRDRACAPAPDRLGDGLNRSEITGLGNQRGAAVHQVLKITLFFGLNETEMARGHHDFAVPGHGAQNRTYRLDRAPDHRKVLLAADPVEDHSGDLCTEFARPMGEALYKRSGALGHM